MSRPLLLDLFCGAGGASKGYELAGFEVVGVDTKRPPVYQHEFIRADAMEFDLSEFDCFHASPPCQHYSSLRFLSDRQHPDLVPGIRERLVATARPFIMENVVGAPLREDYMLCGSMFGLGALCDDGVWRYLRRHRLFETSWGPGRAPTCRHPEGKPIGVYGAGGGWRHGSYMANAREAGEAMGINWMTTRELSQAIPPAYTEFLGKIMFGKMTR